MRRRSSTAASWTRLRETASSKREIVRSDSRRLFCIDISAASPDGLDVSLLLGEIGVEDHGGSVPVVAAQDTADRRASRGGTSTGAPSAST